MGAGEGLAHESAGAGRGRTAWAADGAAERAGRSTARGCGGARVREADGGSAGLDARAGRVHSSQASHRSEWLAAVVGGYFDAAACAGCGGARCEAQLLVYES